MSHRIILEPYGGLGTRHVCPQCSKSHKFTRYIDTQTNQYIADNVGKCDRADNCGYHYTPRQYFGENGSTNQTECNGNTPKRSVNFNRVINKSNQPVSYIDKDTFLQSLNIPDYEKNRLVSYLANLCGHATTSRLIERYYIGNSNRWPGATVFWQVDCSGKVRTGKIMQYDQNTGKRVKEPANRIAWVHKTKQKPDFNLQQCLFGEHLLRGNNHPVCIVESEKTAIIASVYVPGKIWLAAGSIEGLSEGKCSILRGRKVELYPDLNGYVKWVEKAAELSHITRFTVSDYLERIATIDEKKEGLDIADYLIKHAKEEKQKSLIKSMAEEFKVFSNQFAAGEKRLDEYKLNTLEMEQKLKRNNIPLEDFVRETT